ncbi:MAG TPA: secretin N-terminal domain-containing protein, partial [Verrucomicrobiae bacterium]
MKTTLKIFVALFALTVPLLAQQQGAITTIPIDPNATNRDAIARELLRRSMLSNPPATLGQPAVPASPAAPPATRAVQSAPADAPAPPAASAPAPAAIAPRTSPIFPATAPTASPAATTTTAPTPPAKKPEEPIYDKQSVKLVNLDLDEFLDKFYSEVVGRTIIRAPALPTTTKITVNLKNSLTKTEFIQLMDSVLAINGITMIPVGEKFVKAVPSAQALTEAAEFSKKAAGELPDSGNYITHIVQLQYVRPSEIQQVIAPFSKTPGGIVPIEASGVLVLRDNVENVKRILEVIERVDRSLPVDFKSEVIPIKYALASEVASVLGTLTGTGGGVSGGAAG